MNMDTDMDPHHILDGGIGPLISPYWIIQSPGSFLNHRVQKIVKMNSKWI